MDKYLISPHNLIPQRNDLKSSINRRSLMLSQSVKKNKFTTRQSNGKSKRYSIGTTSSLEFQNDNCSIINSRDVLLKKYFAVNDSAKNNDVSSDTRLSSKINHSEMSLLVDNIENISPASPLARSLSQLTMENSPTEPCKTNMNKNPETPKQYPCFDKIKRDLNSPSATVRLRALHALKSPSKIQNYYGYDVPAEEIDIITEEERKPPEKPKSIQEIMKDVIVYIEVRSGVDNRSAGIKNIMFMLGATVNDKLLRNTTHVIFKDGLLSTYNKAKRWNIPLVSILWVEACKKFKRLMNPKYYPISDIDKYENPDIKKIRKYKSMQPEVDNIIKSGNHMLNKKNNKISELGNEDSDDFDEDDVFQPESAKKQNRKNILDDSLKTCDEMIKNISNNLEHLNQNPGASDTSSEIFVKESDQIDKTTSSRLNLGDHSNVTIRRSSRTSSFSSSILNKDSSTPLQSKTPITNRKTLYDVTMDISVDKTLKYDDSANKTNYDAHSMDESFKPVMSNTTTGKRRRTLYTPKYSDLENMNSSSFTVNSTSNIINHRRTLINLSKSTPKSDILNPHDETNNTVEAPIPATSIVKRRRTLYTPQSYSINITTENTVQDQVDTESKKNKEKELSKLISNRKKLRRSLFPSSGSTSLTNDKCNNSDQSDQIVDKSNPKVSATTLVPSSATGAVKKRQLFTSGSYNDVSSLDNCFQATPLQKPKTPLTKIKTSARRSTLEFELNKPKNTTHPVTQAAIFTVNRKREHVMVVTNMHKNEIDVVKEAIKKLGRFKLEQTVTDRTTHLVSFDSRRTINMLRGIIRGVWILNFNWIIDSANSKQWRREEFYELKDFSKAVQLCRTERQAFEGNYKIDLFQDIEPIFISNKSTVPAHYLRELIRSCSGRYTDNIMKARYVLGEKLHNENVLCLNPLWILDSIQENKILKISKYVLRYD